MAAVFPEDIKYDESGPIIHVKQGKGGKPRNVPVHKEFYSYVEKYIGLPSNEPIFKNIPKNFDIHSYRAEFACTWYKKLSRPLDTLTRNRSIIVGEI